MAQSRLIHLNIPGLFLQLWYRQASLKMHPLIAENTCCRCQEPSLL